MLFLSHLIAALAYAGVAFFFGLTLGQRGELGVMQDVFGIAIPVSAVILAAFAKKEGRAYVLATAVAMYGGLHVGQRQFDAAFEDCVARAESVRQALLAREGDYPARLEELAIPLPCRAGFRATILRYLSNDRGFRLWFTNDREQYVATDRAAFSASGRSSTQSPTKAPSRSGD